MFLMEGETVGSASKVILLVEDNSDHAELVRRMFEAHGVPNPVYHLFDGEAALQYLFRQPPYADPVRNPPPSLVLLDLRLPKVDGLKVLKAVRKSQELKHLPVIIISTSDKKEDMYQAYSLKANGYLVKPVEGHSLCQLIQNLMRNSVDLNQPSSGLGRQIN